MAPAALKRGAALALAGLLAFGIPLGAAAGAVGTATVVRTVELPNPSFRVPPAPTSDLRSAAPVGVPAPRAGSPPPIPGGGSARPTAEDLSLNGSEVANFSRSMTVENLYISGSAQFSFGNASWSATLTVLGNIYLSDGARFTIWDAYVEFVGSYIGDRVWYLNDSSRATLGDVLWGSQGLGWDGEAYGSANLTVLDSAVDAHAVLQFHDVSSMYLVGSRIDADLQPTQSARIVQVDSAGSALWFPFGAGNTGTFRFPSPNVETNWSFPPKGSVGIDYRVVLASDWPALFAELQYPGSNITIANTSDLDASFLPINGTLIGSGFHLGPNANFSFTNAQFELRLQNVSVDSWSFYPVNSTLQLRDSQLGEVNGWSGSTMALSDSNLTDLGGYYAAFENSTLNITNCSLGSTLTAYDTSRVVVANSTVAPGEELQAVDDAQLRAENDSLGAGATYAAQQNATVLVSSTLEVRAGIGSAPATGAVLRLNATAGVPIHVVAATDGSGRATIDLTTTEISAGSTVTAGPIVATVSDGTEGQQATLEGPGPWRWDPALVPLIAGIDPPNGTEGVAANATVTFAFAFPMNESSVDSALGGTPAVAVVTAWSSDAMTLSIRPNASWPAGIFETVRIGVAARTQSGLGVAAPVSTSFEADVASGGSAPPTVIATVPADGATGVSPTTSIGIVFSAAMDPGTTIPALASRPGLPPGTVGVSGTVLARNDSGTLRADTTYTITVAGTATSETGVALGAGWSFTFRTGTAPAPYLVSSDPANGSVLDRPPTAVTLVWSQPLAPINGSDALHVTPALGGTAVLSGNAIVWFGTGSWSYGTTYVLAVSPNLSSAAGVPVAHPTWIEFTLEGPRGAASPDPLDGPAELGLAAIGGAFVAVLVVSVFLWRRRR